MSLAIAVEQARAQACLGASEAAGALGMDKYSPPIKVWRRLRGEVGEDTAGEAACWGTAIEPLVRARYAMDNGVAVFVPTESSVLDGWLRATPDGLVVSREGGDGVVCVASGWPEDGDPDGLLQVKTCAAWLADDWIGGPPAKYEIQCRVEMSVCDLPWCDIVCLCGGQRMLGPFRIERDLEIERRLLASLRAFYDRAMAGIEPELDGSREWRAHVGEKMPKGEPVTMTADKATRETLERWRDASAKLAAAKDETARAKTEILLRMSVAGATRIEVGPTERITAYKNKGRWTLRAPASWKDDE